MIVKKRKNRESKQKIKTKKKFLEDHLLLGKSEDSERVQRAPSKEIRWKVPIDAVRNISANERRPQGYWEAIFGYFCVYLPQKFCGRY